MKLGSLAMLNETFYVILIHCEHKLSFIRTWILNFMEQSVIYQNVTATFITSNFFLKILSFVKLKRIYYGMTDRLADNISGLEGDFFILQFFAPGWASLKKGRVLWLDNSQQQNRVVNG